MTYRPVTEKESECQLRRDSTWRRHTSSRDRDRFLVLYRSRAGCVSGDGGRAGDGQVDVGVLLTCGRPRVDPVSLVRLRSFKNSQVFIACTRIVYGLSRALTF